MTGEGERNAAADDLAMAAEELRAAETLLAAGLPRVALTRAYFAVFHAVMPPSVVHTPGIVVGASCA